ncbi:Rpn family recombination-promoting nuclease/putative transposase [Caldifermentibacillus hisashii]
MVESLRVASLDPEARELYEARAKALMDLNSIRGEARQEGIIEGKREANRELAKKMLRKGFEVSDIMEITELTETEIEKLMVEINTH